MSARNSTLSVVQLNMNGARIVPEQLMDYGRENNVDVFLLQETLVEGTRLFGFDFASVRTIFSCKGGPAMAAIAVINPDIEVVVIEGVMDRFFAVASQEGGWADNNFRVSVLQVLHSDKTFRR